MFEPKPFKKYRPQAHIKLVQKKEKICQTICLYFTKHPLIGKRFYIFLGITVDETNHHDTSIRKRRILDVF